MPYTRHHVLHHTLRDRKLCYIRWARYHGFCSASAPVRSFVDVILLAQKRLADPGLWNDTNIIDLFKTMAEARASGVPLGGLLPSAAPEFQEGPTARTWISPFEDAPAESISLVWYFEMDGVSIFLPATCLLVPGVRSFDANRARALVGVITLTMTTIQDIEDSLMTVLATTDVWDDNLVDIPDTAYATPSDEILNHCDSRIESVNGMLGMLSSCTRNLERIRARLGVRRNTQAKINALPEEVLRMIFHCCTRDCCQSLGAYVPHPAFTLSWTCSYWRKICLDDRLLWNHIAFNTASRTVAEELLRRSKEYPLAVNCCIASLPNMWHIANLALQLLPAVMTRVKELSLDTGSDDVTAYAIMDSPAPLLERFSYVSIGELYIDGPLFSGLADRLRHLALANVRMPWNSSFYRNLSTLSIRHFDSQYTHPEDIDMCCIFQGSPLLEELELVGDRYQRLALLRPSCPSITLTRLRIIVLRLPLRETYHLLSSIQAPRTSDLRIVLTESILDSDASLLVDLFDADVLPYSALDDMYELRSHMAALKPSFISATGRPDSPARGRQFKVEWSHHLCTDVESETFKFRQLGRRAFAHPGLKTVRTLSLSSDYNILDHPFEVLTRLPALETIDVNSATIHPFLREFAAAHVDRDCAPVTALTLRSCSVAGPQIDRLVNWCNAHRSLRKLVFDQAWFYGIQSPSDITSLVRSFQNRFSHVDIDWKGCVFNGKHDKYRVHCDPGRLRYTVTDSRGQVVF